MSDLALDVAEALKAKGLTTDLANDFICVKVEELGNPVKEEWRIRILEERAELGLKLNRLELYLRQHPVPLLIDQAYYMREYLRILNRRISMFEK
jgi:hypothetical protein